MNGSKWAEIRNCHEDDKIVYINGYLTDDQDEEGRVIAKVDLSTKEVNYIDQWAKEDSYAQQMIKEVLNKIN